MNTIANLTKRDADIALRPSSKPPESLVGRRIAEVAFAIYASPAYLRGNPAKRELARHHWLAPDASLASTTIARWMQREIRDARVALRTDSIMALKNAAAAGLGVAALPCYLGDASAALRRVRGIVPGMATELWLLTHADLKGTARIRAVMDALSEALADERDLFEGLRPRPHAH
jgi:DNA-binding transcriptional LysR family regulator